MTKEEEDEAFLASIRLDPEAHAQALARKDATADPLAKVVKATKQQPRIVPLVGTVAAQGESHDGPPRWAMMAPPFLSLSFPLLSLQQGDWTGVDRASHEGSARGGA